MNFFKLQVLLALLVVCGVACCVCTIPEYTGQNDDRSECLHNQYWNSVTGSCEFCICPAGQWNTAELCGFGFLVGRYECVDCPDGTFHHFNDNLACRKCKICDPDAIEETGCTSTTDRQCKCKKGFGAIREHCVSCQDHPNAKGCPEEYRNTTSAQYGNTTPALNTIPSESPNGGDDNPVQDPELKSGQEKDKEDEIIVNCTGWAVGMGFTGLSVGILICILIGIAICKTGNRAQGNRQILHESRGPMCFYHRSPQRELSRRSDAYTPTANDASASNKEADPLVHRNGATLPIGRANSI